MINSFKQYLVEEDKAVYFTFGRMNPPTVGHGKLLDKLAATAGKNPYRVYLSQSTDTAKNPLNYTDKIKHVRRMFPKHARQVMINKGVRTAIDALVALYSEGFNKVVMVVGSDRIREFDVLMNKYNGVKARHGFYNFESIKVVSAGERDPDAEGVEGMSASKQRENAKNNDFAQFSQGLPKSMSNKDARHLFNNVRSGMGLKEERDFKRHIQLTPVSDLRESYVKKNLFELGEQVVMPKNDNRVGMIQYLGSNYIIVESKGERWRCWIDDVAKVDPAGEPRWNVSDINATPEGGVVKESINESKSMYSDKPDWGTPEATKKAKSVTPGQPQEGSKGLWHNIQARRKKGLRPLRPGEKNYPKTLDIEEQGEMDRARQTIARDKKQARDMIAQEKERDAKKHDQILDRARRAIATKRTKGLSK